MNALRVQDLQLNYGKKQVLRNVTFEVEAGEFFVVIGPNGSGKTSLVKTIAGLTRPTSGAVELLGRPQGSYSRREFSRKVAVVSQHVPTDFPFRVAETVLMGRSPHLRLWQTETEEDRQLAEEAMRFTDVLHLADRRLDQLSGGERQLVFIARAVCQSPQLLLLDEPTAALDPAHQIKILDLMEQLRSRHQVTVIMVSHDLNLAAMYGDRLLLLAEGEVASLGTPRQVLTYQQLERTYGCLLLVDDNPLGQVPRVIPVPEKFQLR
jgi:iron complex transport system ATP-binding protein